MLNKSNFSQQQMSQISDLTIPFHCADDDLGWKPVSQVFPALEADWKSWLLDAGSLTQRLKMKSHQEFRVSVLDQSWSRHSSPALLQCFDEHLVREAMWSRKVVLIGNNTPWVTAHSLVPADSLRGPLRRICKLQNKPLGEFLFRHPLLKRRQFEVARTGDGWGRRSIFYLFGKPLLVAEFFLPAILHTSK
jgi:chorismate lyase